MKQEKRARRWWARGAAVLLGAAVLGSGAQGVEAQPKAAPAKAAPAKAAPPAKGAAAKGEPAKGPQAKELAEAAQLDGEAKKLRGEGKYEAALPLAERSLAIMEKALGPDHPDVAKSLNNLANVYYSTGDYARALSLYQRSLTIMEKALGPDHPNVAGSLNSLANVYYSTGDYARALSLHQRALAIREKALGPDHPDVATSLNNLANVYDDMGDHTRALPLYQRAVAIQEKALGPDHPDVASSLHNLAAVYGDMGDHTRALPLHQRALAIQEKALGPDHPIVTTSLTGLASVYSDMGDYARALPLFQRALAIREKAFGPDHPVVAESLDNLATVYGEMGDYARALPLHQRALGISEKALGPDHPDVAYSLDNLASVYRQMGDHARALPLYQRALAIREKALGPDHPDVAYSLVGLAEVYRGQGDLPQAERFYQRALAVREKALGLDHPNVAESLDGLAALAEARGDFSGALPFAERAAEFHEKYLTQVLPTGAEAQKRASLAKVAEDVDHNFWRALHTADPRAARLALTTLLRRKGRALDATAESMRVLRSRLGAEAQPLFDELLAVRSQRSALVLRGPDPMPLDKYNALLDELLKKDRELEEKISQKSDAFRASAQPITLDAAKAALPSGSALVEWGVYRPFNPKEVRKKERLGIARYGACIQKPQGEPRCIDLGDAAAIDTSVSRLRKALSRAASPDVKALGRDLYQKVMAPIQKLLGDTRWVFLSPDGALNLVPFAALVDEEGHYLLESYALTYLTSGRDLIRLAADKPAPRDKPTIVAAPDFDAAESAPPVAASAPSAAAKTYNPPDTERGVRSTDLGKLTFSPLLGTAREARTLAGSLGDTRLFVGPEATETAVKALRGPRLLHIATHGFFLPDQTKIEGKPEREDPLLRSGLALAGANGQKSGNEDGVLTALEVTGEDLYGTQLVVLSACETGLGDVENGDGVYGLRRALVVSGARTQIMSLWKVDDQATEALMKAYYARLQSGEGRGEAMRQVQLSMMAQPNTAPPYYWASFLVSGDWTTLEGKAVTPSFARVQPGPRGCTCALPGEAPARSGGAWAVLAALGFGLMRRASRRARLLA